MLNSNDRIYTTYRTREHEREVQHITLVKLARKDSNRTSHFQNLMAAVGRKLIQVGSTLEERYSCGTDGLPSLPAA